MRIQLGELAARGLHVERPGAGPEAGTQRFHLANAEALTGELDLSTGELTARDVACARLALSEVLWAFGSVVLGAANGAELTDVRASAHGKSGALALDLVSTTLVARPLALTLPTLSLEAEVEARGIVLHTHASEGRLACEQAWFRGLSLRARGLDLSAPELVAHNLVVGWGAGFQLAVDTASVGRLVVAREGLSATLEGLTLAALSVDGPRTALGQARVERVQVAVDLLRLRAPASSADKGLEGDAARAVKRKSAHERTADPQVARSAGDERKLPLSGLLDWSLLDGLSGRIDADVHVDLTVPVLGRRRAKHELRLVVDGGAIDYRALEHGLATLEDSLLDFSVRDGSLVLERGLPLLKTRGRGKPIIKWELGPEDLALAEQRRVRLAVLPQFQPARARDESDPEERKPGSENNEASSLALRECAVLNIEVVLGLLKPSVASSIIRELTFANLTLRGELRHDADTGVPPGQLEMGIATLRVLIEALPIGAQALRARLEVASLSGGSITFADLRPRTVTATLEGVAVADVEAK